MIAICKHCKQSFPTLQIPIVGESVNKKFIRYVETLGQHVRDVHRKYFEADVGFASQLSASLIGLALIWNFDCADTDFLKQRDIMRAQFMQLVGRTVRDEDILKSVTNADWANPRDTALKLLTDLRDMLTYADAIAVEENKAAVQQPAILPGVN